MSLATSELSLLARPRIAASAVTAQTGSSLFFKEIIYELVLFLFPALKLDKCI
jgi:hypothetical protein